LPGVLVIGSPLLFGFLFGPRSVGGLLAGCIVSGVQIAFSFSNTGGAWDNAKKYIEEGNYGGKHSEPHKAAVVGDTVGDPLKDTAGPALNPMIKVMNLVSLIIAPIIVASRPAGSAMSPTVMVMMVICAAGLIWSIWRSKKPAQSM
jgi:K(+)-stimulated pyrophosphate-energized sodium pump